MNSDPSGITLVGRAAAGDMVAFERLFMAERRRVLAYIAKRLPAALASFVEPQDVLQDTLFEAFRHCGTFEPHGDDPVFRWLRTIAKNRIINLIQYRRAAKRGGGWTELRAVGNAGDDPVVSLLDQVAQYRRTPSASAAEHEMVMRVEDAMALLSPDHREVLTLRYFENLSVEEAAARLSTTKGAVHMLSKRALASLRACCAGE